MKVLSNNKSLPQAGSRGFSTLELLLAFALLTLSLSAAVEVIFGGASAAIDIQTNREALERAGVMLEDAQAQARADFASVRSIAPVTDGIYQKQITIAPVSEDAKWATSTVRWQSGGRELSVELSTLVTDYAHADDSCKNSLTGDWRTPVSQYYPTDLSIAGIAAAGKHLYVAATSAADGKTFALYNAPVQPGEAPRLAGALNVGSLAAVAVSGNYAYAAAKSTKGQLVILNVAQPSAPKISATSSVSGGSAGSSIAYRGGYVYLGLAKSAHADEFTIFDVGGDTASPEHPVRVGGFAVGHKVSAIAIAGNYALVGAGHQVLVLTISDKAHPVLAATYDGLDNFGDVEALQAAGSTLLMGGSFANRAKEFQLLSLSALPAMALQGGADFKTISALLASNGKAFVLSSSTLQVLDITNPATITTISSVALNGKGIALSCDDGLLYAAVRAASGNRDSLSIFRPQS